MSLSLEEVRRSAALSRLQLTAAEEVLFAAQLARIVEYIDQLDQFESLDATTAPAAAGAMAEDRPEPFADPGQLLELAPESRTPFFVVPRMLAGDARMDADPSDE
ncbi:MAG: Asp-tRNA(Asn)/Glu-tRNA(Gln) amidotransferase subunit GatC [Thermoanaerobaculia bacterium]